MPKRLRNGQAKSSSDPANGKQHDAKDGFSSIEAEILALGGSAEDFELIADVPSDSEYEVQEPTKESAKALHQDLRKMVEDLGVTKVAPPIDYSETSADTVSDEGESSVKAAKSSGKKTRFPPQSEWHAVNLPALPVLVDVEPLPVDLVKRLQDYGKTLLEADNKLYAAQNRSATSAHQFYSTIMSSGTLSDKISALTLSVQESPLHNMKALETLLNLARKRSRSQAVEVLGALKDLFGPGAILPSARKLQFFSNQPGLNAALATSDLRWKSGDPLPKPLQEVHLVSWAYEDWLKTIYFEIIKIIEIWCNDEVVFARGRAVDYIYNLLRDKPEQEANLLRLLVNKLGDSDKKVASKTSYNLLQLQVPHPLMKSTIVSAIESDLLFRPGQSLHAKYYAIITLNQTSLSAKQESVTKQLLAIYFDLFTTLLAKPTVSATDALAINKKGEIQGGGGSAGKKARKKQVKKESTVTSDDQLREKMLSAILTGVNRAVPYVNTNDEAFEKHMNTLFKVTHSANFNTSIQALMLIQQLVAVHPGTADRFYRTMYESLLDHRLLTTSKQALYLNLLYRAMRADLSVKRVKAFIKRLLQVASLHQASFASAAIYLVREIENVFPSVRPFIDQTEAGESEDEEVFKDVAEDSEVLNSGPRTTTSASGTHEMRERQRMSYDGRKRDPQHSNAENSAVWELATICSSLNLLIKYFHPSVALFASRLASHEAMPPKPDLASNTLTQFLDRFVYRNPKIKMKPRGASVMQPLAGGDTSGLLVPALSKNHAQAPVSSARFLNMDIGKVAEDEVFFHKYFSTIGKGKDQAKKKKENRKTQAVDDSEAEEDEDEIWQALVNSRPELEGSDDDEMESLPEDDAADRSSLEDFEKPSDDEESAGELDVEEDEEGLIGTDDDLPGHVEMEFADGVEPDMQSPSAKEDRRKSRAKKRSKLKDLPMFASADDYAKILDEEDLD